MSSPILKPLSSIIGLTNLSIVPGDIVDSIANIVPFSQTSNTVLTADITYLGSIFFVSSMYGVGTVIIYLFVFIYSFENSIPFSTAFLKRSSRPSSLNVRLPDFNSSTILSFKSVPTTSIPLAANINAVGNPMYPSPIIFSFFIITTPSNDLLFI